MISKHYFPSKGTRAPPQLSLNVEQGISLESETTAIVGDDHCLDYPMRSLQKSPHRAPLNIRKSHDAV